MRKAIFIFVSLLLTVSIVAIPADTVSARPASSSQLSLPSPAQQEDEEEIIKLMLGELNEAKDILDELKQAKQLTEDMDIRDQIDAIIEKVKKIEGLIKAGQNEAALEEKRALSKELESLVMGYGPGETEAITRADLDELTKACEALIAASEKISELIEIETSAEQVDVEAATGVEVVATSPDELADEEALIEEVLGHLDEVMNSIDEGQVTTDDSDFANTIDAFREEVKRIQKLMKDGEKEAALVAKSQLLQQFVVPIMLLNLAIPAVETKLALHRVNRQLVLAFHTLQELIAAELPPAEEEEKPIKVEVTPPEVEPVEPLPGVPGAVPPDEEPEEEKSEVEKAVDEHMKILGKLRQEAEVKAGEKDKSEEEAQKSQEAFEKLDEWLDEWADTVVRREVEEELAEPVETEMVPLELVEPGPIVVHIETPPSEEEALTPVEFSTSTRIDVSMFECITENTEAKVKITAVIIDETSETEGEIVIEVEGSEVTLIGEGAEATTTLPLVIKENKLYSGEDENLYPISLLPGDIVSGLEIAPEEISLEYDENQAPVYRVCLKEEGKLLGFLPLKLPLAREVTIDAAWGDVLSITKPWWSFSVSKIDIPEVFYQVKGPPCLCDYIEVKVKKGPEKPTTKLVKRTEKLVAVKIDTTEYVRVYVEYYETTITLYLTVTLKCCPTPKNKECTANITVTSDVSSWDAGSVPAFDKWVPRAMATSSNTTAYATKTTTARKKGEEIKPPLQVKWECGKGTWSKKTETFQLKGVIYSQRHLTRAEYDKDKNLKPEKREGNMMGDTDASVSFGLNVTCEGWKAGETAVYDKQGNEITQPLLLTVKLKPVKPGKPWKVEVVDKAKTKTKKGKEKDAKKVLASGVKVQEKEPCKLRPYIKDSEKR